MTIDRARVHAAVDALLDALFPVEASPPVAPAPTQVQTPLVDKRELARLFAVSAATIDRLVRAGMPFQPVGDVRRFDVPECKAWLANRGREGTVPPAPPHESSSPARASKGGSGVRCLSRAR